MTGLPIKPVPGWVKNTDPVSDAILTFLGTRSILFGSGPKNWTGNKPMGVRSMESPNHFRTFIWNCRFRLLLI